MRGNLRTRISTHFRKRRDAILSELIDTVSINAGRVSILDVGGRLEYWQRFGLAFLRDRNVKITLLNLQASELPDRLADDLFEARVGNGCDLAEFREGQFDIVHSNSVIEHVGNWKNMEAFAREARRVGRSVYAQTPYFWFPIDPHYYTFPMFHWFPRPIRAMLLNRLPLAFAGRIRGLDQALKVVDGTRLLNARQFSVLFPDATIIFERFLKLPKSMIAIRLRRD
jgi:hypothetical protein